MQSNETKKPVTKPSAKQAAPVAQQPVAQQPVAHSSEDAKNQLLQTIALEMQNRDKEILSLKRQIHYLLTERASNKQQIASLMKRLSETASEAAASAAREAGVCKTDADSYFQQLQKELDEARANNGGVSL